MRAMWSSVNVFSLSLKPYVGTPPNRRSVASMQAITVGSVLSRIGSTTRKRLQASQAHHNHVRVAITARHIVGCQDLHKSPRSSSLTLSSAPVLRTVNRGSTPCRKYPELLTNSSLGRSRVRLWAGLLAVSGPVRVRLRAG